MFKFFKKKLNYIVEVSNFYNKKVIIINDLKPKTVEKAVRKLLENRGISECSFLYKEGEFTGSLSYFDKHVNLYIFEIKETII